MTYDQLDVYLDTYEQFRTEFPELGRYVLHEVLKNLGALERKLNNYNTMLCNGIRDEQQEESVQKRVAAAEYKVRAIVASWLAGCTVSFNHDPRGAAICLHLPSGRYNSWDGETWRLTWMY